MTEKTQETYPDLEKEALASKSRRMIHERILVKPEEEVTETGKGIIIPKDSRKRPSVGTVIMVGDGAPGNPMKVKEGERVLFNRYAGQELILNGVKHFIILQNEVQMILDKNDEIDFEM